MVTIHEHVPLTLVCTCLARDLHLSYVSVEPVDGHL